MSALRRSLALLLALANFVNDEIRVVPQARDTPICRRVNGRGNTGTGYNLVTVDLDTYRPRPGDLIPAPNGFCLVLAPSTTDAPPTTPAPTAPPTTTAPSSTTPPPSGTTTPPPSGTRPPASSPTTTTVLAGTLPRSA